MDYLNPKKRKWHLVRIFTGYGLIAIAVALAVVILYYLVLGFSYKDGVVVRNGMLFVSSAPRGAKISLNGQPAGTTNKRIVTQAGKYKIELTRDGYRSWRRTVTLGGGNVQRYNYPFLIPDVLTSSPVLSIDGSPSLATQSPNGHWLVVGDPADLAKLTLVDLSDPAKLKTSNLVLPANLLAAGKKQDWKLIGWASDNTHLLLRHGYDDQYEYIVVDISNPAKSVNLETKFGQAISKTQLFNQQPDEFWFYDPTNNDLSLAGPSSDSIKPYLENVLAYKPFGDDIVLYVTPSKDGKTVQLVWYQNGKSHVIVSGVTPAKTDSDYLLDLAQFNGNWYVVFGTKSGGKVAIYKNPVSYLGSHPKAVSALALQYLNIKYPGYIKFSNNAQFILAENGKSVAVYNIRYKDSYTYELDKLDSPQTHVDWIDGFHLLHVAGGQAVMSDFNNLNQQALVLADARYKPFLSASEEYLFTFTTSTKKNDKTTTELNRTPLRLPADL